MAQQGETPINLSAPAPPQEETPNRSATAKRQRDDGDEIPGPLSTSDLQPIKRRIVSPQDILFRILVPSREIGKVIGKGGSRVQKVRDVTKATIKIADAIARGEERVILIGSKDSEKPFSDAENALHQIGSLILMDDGSEKIGTGHVAANTIRLLISGCQAGAIIGVSGQNIEKLRNSSGATITVLAQSQLPLCASAHESDRVVQMSGDVPAVLRALVEIGCQLRENPPKQIISISPAYNIGFHQPHHQYVDPNSAEYVTLEMMIPETYMGGLIGRCGSNISRIRTESGATIKVHGGKGEQNQRQISLGGNAQQVAVAKQRIDEYLYSQMIQQTGVQQSVVPNPVMMPAQPPTYYAAAPPQAPLPYYVAPSYHTPQL